jgi:phosphoribosyl-dephospho-CoA transferase
MLVSNHIDIDKEHPKKHKRMQHFKHSDTKCIICQKQGHLCQTCSNSYLKPVQVEIDYTYRMKREFEKLLEKKIDQINKIDSC